MNYRNLPAGEPVNQALEPILMRAIYRFRALLPSQVELALEMSHDNPRVRAQAQHLEEVILSAAIVAWQSMGGLATQIVVEMREVLLDDVVLDRHAEKRQGGLPPRAYAWLVVSNGSRSAAGPFHSLIRALKQIDDRPSGARRLKLTEMRRIVDEHHGWMTAAAEPEKGSAFDIYLPTVLPLEIPAINASGSDLKHIMYVDDYDAMRELITETLPDAGFQVSCFESGKAALAALQADPLKYDALVTDYRLHGFSGIDLLRQIKPIRPDLPVIIISGYVDDALKQKAKDEGAASVISKTSDLSELCMVLRRMLGSTPDSGLGTFSEWSKL